MQIREKGKKVLCIRTEYHPDKKRTIGKTVASQNKYMSTVSDEVCQQLEKEEVDQLKKWLSDREERRSAASLKSSLSICQSVMSQSAEALDNDAELSDEHAARIIEGMNRLKKSLRKRGHKVTQQTKKKSASPVEDERQLPLDST